MRKWNVLAALCVSASGPFTTPTKEVTPTFEELCQLHARAQVILPALGKCPSNLRRR